MYGYLVIDQVYTSTKQLVYGNIGFTSYVIRFLYITFSYRLQYASFELSD
jgi:hypothetical protein